MVSSVFHLPKISRRFHIQSKLVTNNRSELFKTDTSRGCRVNLNIISWCINTKKVSIKCAHEAKFSSVWLLTPTDTRIVLRHMCAQLIKMQLVSEIGSRNVFKSSSSWHPNWINESAAEIHCVFDKKYLRKCLRLYDLSNARFSLTCYSVSIIPL